MKRIFALISPVVFLIFTACSDDSKPPPPPPQASCTNQQSLNDLNCVAQVAQQICCTEQTQNYQNYGPYCQMAVAQSSNGYPLPPPPPAPAPKGQIPPQIPGCSPSTQPLTCNQAIMNFELQYKTTYATCQSNDSQAWKQQQGASVVTCVGANNGVRTVDQYYNSPQAQCQTAYAYQNFQSSAPATLSSSIPAGAVPALPTAGAPATLTATNTFVSTGTVTTGTGIGTNTTVVNTLPTEPATTLPTEPVTAALPTEPTGLGFANGQVLVLKPDTIPAGL